MQLSLPLPWTVLGYLMRACNAIPRALLAARGGHQRFAAEDRRSTLRIQKHLVPMFYLCDMKGKISLKFKLIKFTNENEESNLTMTKE